MQQSADGVPTLEDKVLQRAVVMLLEPIYEEDFYPFSYGFRPGRSAHDALASLRKDTLELGGNWVIDLDIQSFFDPLDHVQLREFIRARVVDGVVMRLIGKWLRAGVIEDGVVTSTKSGTPQGGVLSPLLANLYLHVVLDCWFIEAVVPRLRGRGRIVRYADDAVILLTRKDDAVRLMEVLPKRFARFGLTLHPEKTKLVRYHRPQRGGARPETFDFLGFTHFWSHDRKRRWAPKKKTSTGRFTRTARGLRQWIRHHRHLPIAEQSRALGRKLRGVYNYWGLPGNSRASWRLYEVVRRAWKKWLSRRSQRRLTWRAFAVRIERRFPLPKPVMRKNHRQMVLFEPS